MINKYSKKRQKQQSEYSKLISKKEKNVNCFFCNKPITVWENHHLKGRDGDLLTNEKYIVKVEHQCHIYDYHNAKTKDLVKKTWYEGFLERLADIDINLLYKELYKQVKANILSNEEYLEEVKKYE